tara:strand:- start:226 stop:831 length:606 start_codon:yes stop_codon:yes gene_type:complete
MKIGYCRVSTKDQSFDLQEDAIKKEGCEKIYYDVVSGAKSKRKGLDEMLSQLREGDVIVVYKIDRLGRSLRHLVELINFLSESGIGLKSLNDPVDTTSAQGRLVTNIFASIAEFERELIQERTKAGLAAARARGRIGGRKPGLSRAAISKAIVAATLYTEGELSVKEIADNLKISKSTLYKYLRYRNIEISKYAKPTNSES